MIVRDRRRDQVALVAGQPDLDPVGVLGEERVVVNELAGTTRDPVDSLIDLGGEKHDVAPHAVGGARLRDDLGVGVGLLEGVDPVFGLDHLNVFPRVRRGELYDVRRTDDLRVPRFERPDGAGGTGLSTRVLNSASAAQGGAVGTSLVGVWGHLGLSVDHHGNDYGVVAEDDVLHPEGEVPLHREPARQQQV